MSAAYRSAIAARTPVGSDRNGVPLSSRSACSTTAIAQRSRKPTRYERDERVLGSYGLRPPGPLIRPPPGRWPVSTSTTPTLRIRTEVLQTHGRSRYLAAAGSSAEPGNILTIGRVRVPARECVCLSQTPYAAESAPAEAVAASKARGKSASSLRRPVLSRFWHPGSAAGERTAAW